MNVKAEVWQGLAGLIVSVPYKEEALDMVELLEGWTKQGKACAGWIGLRARHAIYTDRCE